MKKTIRIPDSLKRVIEEQNGVFTRQQALDRGVTRSVIERFSREERWWGLARQLWTTTEKPSWSALAWGGVLLGGDGAVIGGEAAAHLWGAATSPDIIDVWVPRRMRDPAAGCWRFRRGSRVAEEGPGPARISLAQAVVDMCVEASVDDIVGHVSRAARTTHASTKQIREVLHRTRRHPNRQLLLDIADDHDGGAESPLERRYLIDVERAHGLPVGTRQVRVSRNSRTDVGYLEFRTLVELDGRPFHSGLAAHSDMTRDNGHGLDGFQTLRYGWGAVAGSPCRVAGEVAATLRRHGWTGQRQPCHRCGPIH